MINDTNILQWFRAPLSTPDPGYFAPLPHPPLAGLGELVGGISNPRNLSCFRSSCMPCGGGHVSSVVIWISMQMLVCIYFYFFSLLEKHYPLSRVHAKTRYIIYGENVFEWDISQFLHRTSWKLCPPRLNFEPFELLYRVYKKKLNRFEIALSFGKQLLVSSFLCI
jgi:hypothetical protein